MKFMLPNLFYALVLLLSAVSSPLPAQEFEPNYDEAKVPAYTLPALLVCEDGMAVKDSTTWFGKRRPEILKLFTEHIYGRSPGLPESASYTLTESGSALNGLAKRKQVDITLKQGDKELTIPLLLYIPANHSSPAPTFLALNFRGNQSVIADPEIILGSAWIRSPVGNRAMKVQATDETRGSAAFRWAMEKILRRGYAVATAYYGHIDPDFDDGFHNGVHGLFRTEGQEHKDDDWGSISGWAWGLSRIMDYLETDDDVDHSRIAVMGHSRLGKTALWAGAQDERFAMVISNNSGCGGASLSRRCYGERVVRINTKFSHWFCKNFRLYNENEENLPVDQHMLLALIAPRPLCVASAQEDRWADPRGEFLSLKHAAPVYRLLSLGGMASQEMPEVNSPVRGILNYHIRSGKHDVTEYDWTQHLNAADRFLMGR
jgi:(4-O-methyl)-D-glucuronate---lignin esterase